MDKHEPTAQYRAMQELRRSSAASPHKDSRTKRARTRAAAKRAAVRDSGSFALVGLLLRIRRT